MSKKSEGFCLDWSEHHNTFFRTAQVFCHSDILTDVTLTCGHESYAAHKLILSVCSVYFSNLFAARKGAANQNMQTVVYLKDVDPKHMALILEFMYNGSITCDEQELPGVLETARGLQVRGLTDQKDEDFGELSTGEVRQKKKGGRKPLPFEPSLKFIQKKRKEMEGHVKQEVEDVDEEGEGDNVDAAQISKKSRKQEEEGDQIEGIIEAYGGYEDEVDVSIDEFDESLLSSDQCPACMKQFFNRNTMKRHYQNVHSKEKPYECWECGFQTSRKSTLRIHCERIHKLTTEQFKEKVKDLDLRIKLAQKAKKEEYMATD